jgi:hypothetical protein
MNRPSTLNDHPQEADLARYPLLQALLARRSRRFGRGMTLNGGPLAYVSAHPPLSLSEEEEAALAFAAFGITGSALAELPYQSGAVPEAGTGNIIAHFLGRTAASPDALHPIILFVLNDDGCWMLQRPQDHTPAGITALTQAAGELRLVECYHASRVQIAAQRPGVPREIPFVPSFNKWSANRPGSTYFLPVAELSALYINILLAAFDRDLAYFVVVERNRFRPAGLARFARSRGGHLNDALADDRIATIGLLETSLYEFAAVEQGGVLQNLALMAEALGLGGFPHFAAHPFIWCQTLGFRMTQIPFARTIGAGPLMKGLLLLMRQNSVIPTAVGLERGGEVLVKPFCPPYYRTMADAVRAFVDYKYAPGTGTLRDERAGTAWRDGAAVLAAIPRPSDEAIDATIAYAEYLYQRYGRFPAASGPFRTVEAYQAHHLDLDFYDTFYQAGAVTEAHRCHMERWHTALA